MPFPAPQRRLDKGRITVVIAYEHLRHGAAVDCWIARHKDGDFIASMGLADLEAKVRRIFPRETPPEPVRIAEVPDAVTVEMTPDEVAPVEPVDVIVADPPYVEIHTDDVVAPEALLEDVAHLLEESQVEEPRFEEAAEETSQSGSTIYIGLSEEPEGRFSNGPAVEFPPAIASWGGTRIDHRADHRWPQRP